MSLDESADKVIVSVASAVLIAVLVWVKKRWLNPLSERFIEPLSQISGLVRDVAEIKKEVQPNGGTSMRDQVGRISDSLSLLEARQRGVLTSLPRAIFETDECFNWIFANPAAERLIGHGFSSLEWRRWLAYVHEEDRAHVMEEVANSVRDKRGMSMAFRWRTDEEPISLCMESIPVFSSIKPNTVICWSGSLKLEHDQRQVERREL